MGSKQMPGWESIKKSRNPTVTDGFLLLCKPIIRSSYTGFPVVKEVKRENERKAVIEFQKL